MTNKRIAEVLVDIFMNADVENVCALNIKETLWRHDETATSVAGLLRLRVETLEQVRPLLQQAFHHDGPALVEVMVNPRAIFDAANDHERVHN